MCIRDSVELLQIQLEAGIYLFEFLDTSIPPQAKTINGAGTIGVETVIP